MDYAGIEDETLLRLIANGRSAGALGELYNRYSRIVFSVAYHATANQDLAEEITQDTFLRAWQHAGSFDPQTGKILTWLTSIARHRAIDLYRRWRVRSEAHSTSLEGIADFELVDGEQNTEASVEVIQHQEQIRNALLELPAEQRQAIALAYFQGLTQEEIARTLDQPLGTVKTRIRLGMQKLRQLIG